MLKRFTLLRKHKKRVFQILQEVGLNPLDFSWEKQEIANAYLVSCLRHHNKEYFFQFSWFEINAWCMYAPARFRYQEQENPRNWDDQEQIFYKWTEYLKEEIESPDLWHELSKYHIVVSKNFPDPIRNEIISAGEAERINHQLGLLAESIVTDFSLEGNQRTFVLSRIGYLSDALKRQMSTDWTYTTLGVCVTIAHNLDLSRINTLTLWEKFETILGTVCVLE